MSTTRMLAHKEWSEYRRDPRLWWTAGVLSILFAVALATGVRYYTASVNSSEAAQKSSYEQWLRQGKKNPHGAAHYGFYAFKPLSLMAVVDKGLESYMGQAVWLEAHNQNEVKEREATDAGSIVRFGHLSVGFLFQVLFPLCIVLLGFNVFSKEREWGTLPLLLGSGASAGQLLQGKAAALYKVVLLLALPMLLLAAIVMFLAGGADAWLTCLPQYLLFCVFVLLYLGVWVLLALYASSLVRRSVVAMVSLLGFWVLGAFFVPRIGGVLARTLYPTPTAFAFSQAVQLDNELGLDRKTPAALRQRQFEDSLLATHSVDTVADLPLNIRGLQLKRGEEYGYRIFEKNYGALEAVYRKQDGVMNWLNLLSPAQCLRSLSAGLSETDVNKGVRFAAQAENHRRLIATVMNDDIARNSRGIEAYEKNETLWQKIPPFRYTPASLWGLLKPQALPLLSLLLWSSLLLLLLRRQAAAIRGL